MLLAPFASVTRTANETMPGETIVPWTRPVAASMARSGGSFSGSTATHVWFGGCSAPG